MKHKSFVMCRILDYRFCCLLCLFLIEGLNHISLFTQERWSSTWGCDCGRRHAAIFQSPELDRSRSLCLQHHQWGGIWKSWDFNNYIRCVSHWKPFTEVKVQCTVLSSSENNMQLHIYISAFSKRFYPNPNYSGYTFLQYVSHNIS